MRKEMNEYPPLGDAILVQFQVIVFPMQGVYHNYWFRPKTACPIDDSGNGIGYKYLTVGESMEVSKGAQIFPKCYTLLYLGQGRVSVSPTYRHNLTEGDVEIITVIE